MLNLVKCIGISFETNVYSLVHLSETPVWTETVTRSPTQLHTKVLRQSKPASFFLGWAGKSSNNQCQTVLLTTSPRLIFQLLPDRVSRLNGSRDPDRPRLRPCQTESVVGARFTQFRALFIQWLYIIVRKPLT